MKALGGKRRVLAAGKTGLERELSSIQEKFIQELRAWRRAHPGAPEQGRALFEEARALRSLGRVGEAGRTLEGLTARGLSPRQRLLAAQWLAEAGEPPSRGAPLLRGLPGETPLSPREKFLLAALLSRTPGKEKKALSLLGGLVPPQAEPDPARVRSKVEDLERALPGLPPVLARPLKALLYKEWLRLLPQAPEAPRLEAALAGLALRPGDPLPRLEGKDLEGRPFKGPIPGKPLLLLFWAPRNPPSLQALKEAASLAAAPGRLPFQVAAVALARRKRDLEKVRRRIPPGLVLLWDPRGRESPLALAFAVDRVPFLVLADSKGRILFMGLTRGSLRGKIREVSRGGSPGQPGKTP